MINGTKVVCLCGSTRFTKEMTQIVWEYECQGIIALGWSYKIDNHDNHGNEIDHHLAEKEGVLYTINSLHLKKIELADEVVIVNVGGYYGNDTKREIAYAEKLGKPVKFYYKDVKNGVC